ncbi:MAG TPA: sigma 54-interacting transcriptional regulator [Symbiobacteriaceae bacterium]|nr:sigma 54-interacting transcriptional regulator [Symbiobacteriaceae bacterium]
MDDPFDTLIGQSRAVAELRRLGRLASRSRATVLLSGETGTGKELMAKAIHRASDRAGRPFVAINCAAVPEGLLEAEFFGYADGAFTGARRGGRPGKFEQADGGTLFLDEVGELAPALQAKLLRVIQEREVEPVGAVRPVRVDVRVIAASNRDLEEMVARNEFRPDLYYRLNVLVLHLPPLRERIEDLPMLTEHLIRRLCSRAPVPRLAPAAVERLMAYHWPGNVRELENLLERALVLAPGPVIGPEHFPVPAAGRTTPWQQKRQEAERTALLGALAQTGGNKTAAARLLGLSRSQFYEKLQRLSGQNDALRLS